MDPADPNGPWAVNINWVPAAPAAVVAANAAVALPPAPPRRRRRVRARVWKRRGRLQRGADGAWTNLRSKRLERL